MSDNPGKSTKKKLPDPVPMIQTPEFAQFRTWIGEAKRILISTHSQPDGDGLGAELAFYHYLKRAKKACRVYNPDSIPTRYKFLDPKEQIILGPGQVELWDTCDLWIIVDTNDPRRLGKLWGELALRSKKIVFLDHHQELTKPQGVTYPPNALIVSDPFAGSIGEMLYHLFDELKFTKVQNDVALGLYVSVMTDTNSFRYARTTPLSHRIAAEMIEHGVNPEQVYQNIYSSKTLAHLQLLGHLLQNVKVASNERLAWLEMTLELRRQHQASTDDTQSFLNLLMLLKNAEIVCLFREEDSGQIRVSMKSMGKVEVDKLAAEFGGGGHPFASGAALSLPMPKAVATIIGKLEQTLNNHDRFSR